MKKRILCVFLCVMLVLASAPLALSAEKKQDPLVYTAIGDSIAAGYGLLAGNPLVTSLLRYNYYSSPATSYPQVLGQKIHADIVYNMGIEAMWASDYAAAFINPDYLATTPTVVEISAAAAARAAAGEAVTEEDIAQAIEAAKYHQLIVATAKRADVLTIHLGGNDLLQGLIDNDLSIMGMGEVVSDFSLILSSLMPELFPIPEDAPDFEIRNPLAYCLQQVFVAFMMTDNFQISDNVLDTIKTSLEMFGSQITLKDVLELLAFFSQDNLTQRLDAYGAIVADCYTSMVQLLREGTEITKEQYDALAAAYQAADEKAKTASHEAADGALSEYEILTEGRLDIYEDDGHYYVRPLNPNAKIALMGTYNPYGASYSFSLQDVTEVFGFLRQGLSILMEALFGGSPLMQSAGVSSVSAEDLDAAMRTYEKRLADAQTLSGKIAGAEGMTMRQLKQRIDGTANAKNAANEANDAASLRADIITMFNNLPAVLIYFVMGQPFQQGYVDFNAGIRAIAEENGLPFVDLMGVQYGGGLDVHPNADGHAYIAEQIYAAIEDVVRTEGDAAIGDIIYETLADAIEHVTDGETIRLLRTCSDVVEVSRSVSFTLNPNGHFFFGRIVAGQDYLNKGFGYYYNFYKAFERTSASLASGTLEFTLNGCDLGSYTFRPYQGGWSIMNSSGKFLTVSNGKLTESYFPSAWTYAFGTFSTTVTTMTKVYNPFNWRAFNIPVVTVQYLSANDGELFLSAFAGQAAATFYRKEAVRPLRPNWPGWPFYAY